MNFSVKNLAQFKILRGLLLCLLTLSLFPGCASRGTLSSWSKEKREQSFKIEYALQNANREIDPWSSFSEDGLQTANWMPHSAVSTLEPKPAELTIEFPHPDGHSETALATLVIYREHLAAETFQPTHKAAWYSRMWPARQRDQTDAERPAPSEKITLELPREHFESIMNELNRSQYLDENERGAIQNDLTALRIVRNDREIHSSHEVAPLLNDLVRTIYTDGDVVMGQRGRPSPSVLQTSGIKAPRPVPTRLASQR